MDTQIFGFETARLHNPLALGDRPQLEIPLATRALHRNEFAKICDAFACSAHEAPFSFRIANISSSNALHGQP